MSLLEAKNIKKKFGDTAVLKDISFSVDKGEVVSVIGSSGGGKTTLLRCLNSLETPDSGLITVGNDIIFDGNEKKLSENEKRLRRLHFGLVFQNFNLFPQYSVLENVCLAPKLLAKERSDFKSNKKEIYAEIEENAASLIARVGLKEKTDSFPCKLSGGQQQRVAIARALALKPDILCFDEPTSALDPELTGEVLKVIRSLKDSRMTMIIVTHEMEFAKSVSDRVMFMSDGSIEMLDTPNAVFGENATAKTRAFLANVSML